MHLKIKGYLKSNENKYSFNYNGTKEDNIITLNDNGVIVKLDLVKNKMMRTTDDYELNFLFLKDEKTINSLVLKDLNECIDMELYTIDIINQEGYFYVNYELNNDELFEFKLRYEGDFDE